MMKLSSMKIFRYLGISMILLFLFSNCSRDEGTAIEQETETVYPAIEAKFGDNLRLNNLYNYANQEIPNYITKDNTGSNPITDKGATLGRVLFYDKELSTDRTISCSSCHQQELAFTDDDIQSQGVNGLTGRHSMRLVNNRFSEEFRFFWDERASSLMNQTTQPIKDHMEMGFSGENGSLNFEDLIARLESLDYYQELFKFVYGDESIDENKIQMALAQFISSIQSFDSKYDMGRSLANNDNESFSNFTNEENNGKRIFLDPPIFSPQGNRISGGAGCAGCHRPPEFDIDPNSLNNGVINAIGGGTDFLNTKAPSLRNVTNPEGMLNSALMHNAEFESLLQVIVHYDMTGVFLNNNNLDPRLNPNNSGAVLNLSANEMNNLISFLKTLSGNDVYTNPKWGNPFLVN